MYSVQLVKNTAMNGEMELLNISKGELIEKSENFSKVKEGPAASSE